MDDNLQDVRFGANADPTANDQSSGIAAGRGSGAGALQRERIIPLGHALISGVVLGLVWWLIFSAHATFW